MAAQEPRHTFEYAGNPFPQSTKKYLRFSVTILK